ncbi:hypothetical protein DL93DRAFT_2173983 [Clavulina sp. PMI_390]|nr:hypothetical protein DL93DRAFT_2173983 [Clavulina sp. PMI_390]
MAMEQIATLEGHVLRVEKTIGAGLQALENRINDVIKVAHEVQAEAILASIKAQDAADKTQLVSAQLGEFRREMNVKVNNTLEAVASLRTRENQTSEALEGIREQLIEIDNRIIDHSSPHLMSAAENESTSLKSLLDERNTTMESSCAPASELVVYIIGELYDATEYIIRSGSLVDERLRRLDKIVEDAPLSCSVLHGSGLLCGV